MPLRYYHFETKAGLRKRRVHDSITGRIVRWEIAEDLDEPEGEFKIVEWVMHWDYNDGTPSGRRHWEIRIQLPEGYDKEEMRDLGEDIMQSYVSEELISESNFGYDKSGVDFIGYEKQEEIDYKIVDIARPQFNYPKKKRWGRWQK